MERVIGLGYLLASVAMGMIPMVSYSASQQPIETRTVVEQQVGQLPEGPLCWDVRRGSLASGSASPASGYHVHSWIVAYVLDGLEYFEYEDGRSGTIWPGQAGLFEAATPHRHVSIGASARTNVGFELTCDPQPNAIANTGVLPLEAGPIAYQIQVRERVWQPGARTPVHILSGPTTTLILEGTIARSTASGGIACSGPGELYVSPVGELAQNTNVSSGPARTLDVDLWPAGETRSVAQAPGVQLPAPGAGTCPAD